MASSSKPSLKGFILLLLKFAFLMAKSNINSNDISFLNSIRYLVNVSSNNTSNADKTED